MKTYHFSINTKELLADVLTPVAIYLKLRDVFPNAILLEGADFKAGENQYSFICLEPVAGTKIQGSNVTLQSPNGGEQHSKLDKLSDATTLLSEFAHSFVPSQPLDNIPTTGLFGYSTYEAVSYFETINDSKQITDLYYQFYK